MLSSIAYELSAEGTKAVLVHGNADMDALGSAYAIARCFPGCAIFAPDGLDRVSKMVAAKMEIAVREGLGEGFDRIVVVDTSSPEQLCPGADFRAEEMLTSAWTRSIASYGQSELIREDAGDGPRRVSHLNFFRFSTIPLRFS